jgi:hypothetical protein
VTLSGLALRIEILIDHQRWRRRREQRVAVGIGAVGEFRADIAGGSGAIFDDDGLAPFARQPFTDNARHGVGGAAGRKRHDDAHGMVREAVGFGLAAKCAQAKRQPHGKTAEMASHNRIVQSFLPNFWRLIRAYVTATLLQVM